jgi:hypothetical protein
MDELFVWEIRYTYEHGLPADVISVAVHETMIRFVTRVDTLQCFPHDFKLFIVKCAHVFQTQSQLIREISPCIAVLFYVQCVLFNVNHVEKFRNGLTAVNEVYNEINRFQQTFLSCAVRGFKSSTKWVVYSVGRLKFAWVVRHLFVMNQGWNTVERKRKTRYLRKF